VKRQLVDSTNVVSIGYDPESRTLEVEYGWGGIYQYRDVPPNIWDAFRSAPSKGAFVYEQLSTYPYERVM
jgi:hypothetical protein